MNKVFLLLGGNLGDRFKLISLAKEKIQVKIGEMDKESSLYETESWGFESDQNFLNQVIVVKSPLSAQKILKLCLEIEDELGRKRSKDSYESRTMDIDILFYNEEIIQEENLVVPHPKLHQRKFTMEPLVEIAPCFMHPKLGKNMQELLNHCNDKCVILKL